jgi:hypothetical protein
LKTWFPLDITLLSIDWITTFIADPSFSLVGSVRMAKALRIAKGLRALKLLRVFKVLSSCAPYVDEFKSDNLLTMVDILKLLLLIVMVCHYIACGWYAIGTLSRSEKWLPPESRTWVDFVEEDVPADYSYSKTYLYATSMHWSVTQFTPASMEVNPRNEIERTYAILVVLSGVVMFSSLVSTITNTMTKLRERNAERAIQRHLVRQYLSDARISVRLAHRIFSFLRKQGYIVQSRLHEGDVAVLKELPEKTLKHLHCEVYAPALVAHPFFHRFDELDGTGFIVPPGSISEICF